MKLKDRLAAAVASCCYLGYVPYAPGTFGSLFGLGIYFLVRQSQIAVCSAALLVTIIGLLVSTRAEKIFNYKDAAQIVIDEAAGMLIALMFIPPDTWLVWFSFFLFRFFDVLKPYPLRKIQRLKGTWGIMFDDIGAGIYTSLTVRLFLKLIVNVKF